MPADYEELRRLAAAYLRGERVEHTLQSTALVHEAYLRLRNQRHLEWKKPAHFVGILARVMRQTLTNYAVAKNRQKRGGADRMELTLQFYESRQIDVKLLDAALRELETLDERQAQIVELRFFGGLTPTYLADGVQDNIALHLVGLAEALCAGLGGALRSKTRGHSRAAERARADDCVAA